MVWSKRGEKKRGRKSRFCVALTDISNATVRKKKSEDWTLAPTRGSERRSLAASQGRKGVEKLKNPEEFRAKKKAAPQKDSRCPLPLICLCSRLTRQERGGQGITSKGTFAWGTLCNAPRI